MGSQGPSLAAVPGQPLFLMQGRTLVQIESAQARDKDLLNRSSEPAFQGDRLFGLSLPLTFASVFMSSSNISLVMLFPPCLIPALQ